MDMATLTLASLWLSSLLVIGSLGWVIGHFARQKSLSPAQFASVGVDGEPSATVCTSPVVAVKTGAKQRASLFETMPPIESVRAQARTILQSEDVWNSEDANLQVRDITLGCVTGRSSAKQHAIQPLTRSDQPASSSSLV